MTAVALLRPAGELLGIGMALALGGYAWRRRSEPGAESLFAFTVGVAIWLSCDVALMYIDPATPVNPLTVAEYVGVATTIAAWGGFVIDFTGYTPRLGRYLPKLLAVHPAVVVLLVTTNPVHQAWYRIGSGHEILGLGVAYWGHLAYTYLLVVGGIVLVLLMVFRNETLYPGQAYLIAIGAMMPLLADIVQMLGLVEIRLRGLALAGSCLMLGVAHYRHDLLQLHPTVEGSLLENLANPALIIDRRGRVAKSNPAVERVLGADDIDGTNARPYFATPGFESQTETILSATTDQQFEIERDNRVYTVRVTPLEDHREHIVGRLVQFQDVTDLRRREREVELLLAVQSRFLRHNVRNELTIVKPIVELLAANSDETSELAAEATASLDRLDTMCEKARAARDIVQTDRNPQRLDICAVLETLVESHRERFPAISFAFEGPATCRVETIPAMELVFENLLENAAEHNDATDPHVLVTVETEADAVVVTVRDNGPGISDEQLNVLGTEETKLRHADGIGLWLVHWAIASSSATIEYETDGSGTEVTVRIPS